MAELVALVAFVFGAAAFATTSLAVATTNSTFVWAILRPMANLVALVAYVRSASHWPTFAPAAAAEAGGRAVVAKVLANAHRCGQ
jgi:hypothetical protein